MLSSAGDPSPQPRATDLATNHCPTATIWPDNWSSWAPERPSACPCVGCRCATCTSDDPRNNRMRCALVLGLARGRPARSTPRPICAVNCCAKILRWSRPRCSRTTTPITCSDSTTCGFFRTTWAGPMPIYCEAQVEERIRKSFDYAFSEEAKSYAGGVPQIEFHRITTEPLEILGQRDRADPAAPRAVPGVGISFRRRGLLHRHQRNSARKLAAARGAGHLDSGRPAARAACHRTSAWTRPWRSPSGCVRGGRCLRTFRTTWST